MSPGNVPASAGAGPFRLVVFDWDGTLVDSIPAIVECTLAALSRIDRYPLPSVEEIRGAIGMGLRDSMEQFFPGSGDGFLAELTEAYRELWLGTYRERVALFPGARAAVEAVGAAGHLLAVATAKSRRGLDRELAATGIGPLFRATRTVDEAPPKPHPEMLLSLCAELAVPPAAALMVGDTTFDLDMARAAGAPAVGVLSGSHARERLAGSGPLAILGGVAELPGWLAARAAGAAAPATPAAG
ncbi:MAG: HAD-IA family hydrolase [Thermoanaerobaculia bacterium]|nr:HAD-IA family hydrolase [Thermoanaerobaculia bacterium]